MPTNLPSVRWPFETPSPCWHYRYQTISVNIIGFYPLTKLESIYSREAASQLFSYRHKRYGGDVASNWLPAIGAHRPLQTDSPSLSCVCSIRDTATTQKSLNYSRTWSIQSIDKSWLHVCEYMREKVLRVIYSWHENWLFKSLYCADKVRRNYGKVYWKALDLMSRSSSLIFGKQGVYTGAYASAAHNP